MPSPFADRRRRRRSTFVVVLILLILLLLLLLLLGRRSSEVGRRRSDVVGPRCLSSDPSVNIWMWRTCSRLPLFRNLRDVTNPQFSRPRGGASANGDGRPTPCEDIRCATLSAPTPQATALRPPSLCARFRGRRQGENIKYKMLILRVGVARRSGSIHCRWKKRRYHRIPKFRNLRNFGI